MTRRLPEPLRSEVVELLARLVVKDLREHPKLVAPSDSEGSTTVGAPSEVDFDLVLVREVMAHNDRCTWRPPGRVSGIPAIASPRAGEVLRVRVRAADHLRVRPTRRMRNGGATES